MALALYLLDHSDEYDYEHDAIELPEDFARDDAERAIVESLDQAEVAAVVARLSFSAGRQALKPKLKQELYELSATCLEIMHRRDPLLELAEAAESVRWLARSYGAYRLAAVRCRPYGARSARRPSHRSGAARIRAPSRLAEDEPEPARSARCRA